MSRLEGACGPPARPADFREAVMHPIGRSEAIRDHLRSYATVLVGESSLLLNALTSLLKETDFHVLATSNELEGVPILDVQPFDGVVLIIQGRQVESTLRQIQSFRTMYEHGRIAVLLDALRWEDTLPFLEAGTHACFPESVAPEVFIKSLEVVMLGESFVSAALPLERQTPQRAASAAEAVPVQFSPQEERILKNIADGDPNKVIARALGIADATVKVHVKNILRKLGVGNRTQAAIWATRHGLAHRPRPTIVAVDGKTVATDISAADDHQERIPKPQNDRLAP